MKRLENLYILIAIGINSFIYISPIWNIGGYIAPSNTVKADLLITGNQVIIKVQDPRFADFAYKTQVSKYIFYGLNPLIFIVGLLSIFVFNMRIQARALRLLLVMVLVQFFYYVIYLRWVIGKRDVGMWLYFDEPYPDFGILVPIMSFIFFSIAIQRLSSEENRKSQ